MAAPRKYPSIEEFNELRALVANLTTSVPGQPTPVGSPAPVGVDSAHLQTPSLVSPVGPGPRFDEFFLTAITAMLNAEGANIAGWESLADNINHIGSIWLAHMVVRGDSFERLFSFYEHLKGLSERATQWSEQRRVYQFQKIDPNIATKIPEAAAKATAWKENEDFWQEKLVPPVTETAPASPAVPES